MKKILLIAISVLLIFTTLSACSEEKASNTSAKAEASNTISTTFYSISLPASFENKYVYTLPDGERYDLQVYIRKEGAYAQVDPLFSINMLSTDIDYTLYSNHIAIGSITSFSGEKYNLIALIPDTMDQNKVAEIKEIIASIKFVDEAAFSTETIKAVTE